MPPCCLFHAEPIHYDGSVWLIGTDVVTPNGNYGIYKWNGIDNWEKYVGGGKQITVWGNYPVIIDAENKIYLGG